MHSTNIINKVVFDIRTDAGLEVLSPEEPFEDFVCTRLIPVVDEVLRTHSTNGDLISIASLEINLGTLGHENIREKMAERLRERLDAAIHDKIRSLQGVPSRQEGVFAEPEATCRLIEQFLSTGMVPWTTDPGADVPLSRLLRNALASHGRQLVAFLKRSTPHIRKRLVRQFPALDLIALVQLLAPDHYQLAIEAVDCVQQSTAVISAGGETAAHLAWGLVFDYLLDREREGFRPDEFVACLISGIAVATGTNTARLVRELSAAAPKLDVASESQSGLQTLLTGLKGDDARDGNKARTEDFERLKPVLVNMLEFGDTSGFDTAWGDLLLYYSGPTRTVIREHGKKLSVRKRIATSFSDPQIREVISLIESENSEFIEAFAHQSALIADNKRVRPPDRSVHKKQIREFVLTYLLVDRGSRFNEKAFTGSVIRQLAAHYNWTYRQLLTSMREAIEVTQPPGPMKERILGIVTELEGELKTEKQLKKEPATGAVAEPSLTALGRLVARTGDKASANTWVPEEAAVLAYLKGDASARPPSMGTLKKALESIILHTPEKLYWFIAVQLDRGSVTKKLVALLSEPFRVRLLHVLLPRHFCLAQRYVDLLRNAASGSGSFDSPDEVNQRIWQGAFSYLRETGLRVFDEKAFVCRMVEFLAEKRKNTDRAAFYADLGRQLAADIQPSTRADHQALIRIVSKASQKLRPSESVPPSPQTQPVGIASVLNEDEETPWDEEIYLANAGMVIAAPYLPRLFELLGLTEQSRFTSREAAERGVHLLQYMVDERTSTPEYRLVLNKILCGVKPGIPIVRGIEITDKETEAITNMMTAMIQNWKIIGNTSISGFRESFLQRKARLTRKNDAWHLQVEERAFDMLLDQIPWSFSTIKYSWMDRVIFVKWRE